MTTAAMAEPATTNGHEEVVEAVQEEAMKDTADSAPATPPVEDVKPVYVVRLPRPDVDETSQKVLQTEIDIHMGKIKLLNEHMNIKRGEKEVAYQHSVDAREQLREVQKERNAVLEQLKPLREARNSMQANLSAHKDERKELSVRSEEELDKRLAEIEYKMQHESLTLNEEKQLMKDMKKLEGQRERVRGVEAQASSVDATMLEKEKLHGSIKELEQQLSLIRNEENTQNEIYQKFRKEEQDIEDAMKGIKEERSRVSEVKDGLYSQLQTLLRGSRKELREYYDVRRLVLKAEELMAEGKWEEAQQLTLVHNEAVHEKLATDSAFNTEYCRLLEKNRRLHPMIPNMSDDADDDWEDDAGKTVLSEDVEKQAKAKAKDMIAALLSEAEQEVAAAKRAPPPPPAPVPEPEPEPVAPPKAVSKPPPKPKAVLPVVTLPVIDIDDTFVPPPKDDTETDANKSEAELKEELRQHNLAAAKEAAERKARRQQAAEKKKVKAEEAARRRELQMLEADRRKAAGLPAETATPVVTNEEATPTVDVPAAAQPTSSLPKGNIPPPKSRPPLRKAQKGMLPMIKKTAKDNPAVLWGGVFVALLATVLHFALR